MSGSVVAQPQDIERFASELQRFNDQLVTAARQLQSQFVVLGDTWRDPQFEKFGEEFVMTMRVLYNFSLSAEEQIPYLQQHAQLMWDVIHHRRR